MENYEFVSKIAEGAYGTVWRCVDKTTGEVVAVKKLKEPAPVGTEVRCGPREKCLDLPASLGSDAML